LGTGLASGLGRRVGAGLPGSDSDQQAVKTRTAAFARPPEQVNLLPEAPTRPPSRCRVPNKRSTDR
jgi:hypothetical protein